MPYKVVFLGLSVDKSNVKIDGNYFKKSLQQNTINERNMKYYVLHDIVVIIKGIVLRIPMFILNTRVHGGWNLLGGRGRPKILNLESGYDTRGKQ